MMNVIADFQDVYMFLGAKLATDEPLFSQKQGDMGRASASHLRIGCQPSLSSVID